MLVVHCPPASGKTFLTKKYPGVVYDNDDLLEDIGLESSHSGFLAIQDSKNWQTKWLAAFNKLENDGFTIFTTNMNVQHLCGVQINLRAAYKPTDYIRHVEMSGRKDLLLNFGFDELKSWMSDYVSAEKEFGLKVHWMKPGHFIDELIF
uniref:Uncharacterized protein n=1 Tax=viral metagenome TaxID=1070528 RepID=A0A2V0RBE6_9ZZZZ